MQVTGEILAVLATLSPDHFVTMQRPRLNVDLQGIPGDRHYGFTRPAAAREPWYKRGTPIRSGRQITVVSEEELAQIAAGMGIPLIEPGWVGANVLVRGIAHLSGLAAGARLFCGEGAVLVSEGYNPPCKHTGAEIANAYPQRAGLDTAFVKVAKGLRGILATVEREGVIAPGAVTVKLPLEARVHATMPA
jgi:MOSC domain-containing protein YiiM